LYYFNKNMNSKLNNLIIICIILSGISCTLVIVISIIQYLVVFEGCKLNANKWKEYYRYLIEISSANWIFISIWILVIPLYIISLKHNEVNMIIYDRNNVLVDILMFVGCISSF